MELLVEIFFFLGGGGNILADVNINIEITNLLSESFFENF